MKTREIGVWGIVFGSLLLCELTIARLEPALSGDVRHIQSFGEVSSRLAGDSAPLKVLWLGNSITGEGIDLALADSVFEHSLQHETGVYAVHPDGSAIAEWTHIASNEFFERGAHPDVLIIPFAWNLLSDQSVVDAERIGRWYLRQPSDWIEFLRFDAQGFEERARAILANLSAAFGNRDRVRTRVLAALPGYEEMALGLSRGGRADEAPSGPAPAVESTYGRLQRLAGAADRAGTHVVLVAMPVRDPYEVEPGLLDLVTRRGFTYIDARVVDGLDAGAFRDEMHLLPHGARTVTQQVATRLVGTRFGGGALGIAGRPNPIQLD